MSFRKSLLIVLVGLAALLAGCGGDAESAIATGIAQTMQISQLETAAAGNNGGAQATAAPADTQEPGEPTSTTVPTLGIAYVSVTQNTNCRRGPSVAYDLVTTINTGQQVQVLKTFSNSEYVVVQNPNGAGDCWLWLRYANTTDFAVYELPTATQPPTPTATPTPMPSFAGDTWTNRTHKDASSFNNSIAFAVSGNSISGSTTWGAYNYTFTGTLSANGQQASGTWTSSVPSNGSWSAYLLNNNQFNGTIGFDWSFCGWRGGAGEPSPCLAP